MMSEDKRKIIRAWVKLLSERPVEDIRLEDLLELAEVDSDTFRNYFKSAASMPAVILAHENDVILERMDAAETNDEALNELYSFFKNRRRMLSCLYGSGYRKNTISLVDTASVKLARILLVRACGRGTYSNSETEQLADSISECIRKLITGTEGAEMLRDDLKQYAAFYPEKEKQKV